MEQAYDVVTQHDTASQRKAAHKLFEKVYGRFVQWEIFEDK